MDTPKKPPSTSAAVYGIYSPAFSEVIYTKSVTEARAHLSTPELCNSGGRFKRFGSKKEAELYFSSDCISKMGISPGMHTRIEDGYRSPFSKLKPQEHSRFLKLIQNGKNDEALQLMNENPHYFIDMSIDQPSILHMGCRFNTLHICARFNNLVIAKEVLKRVQDADYITEIYQTPSNAMETSANLVDRFLNTPDKGSGRTPLLLAARAGFGEMVWFLSSFPESQLPSDDQINDIQRSLSKDDSKCEKIIDYLRHPSKSYCVTLYKEKNNDDMPFLAITSRFPHDCIDGHQMKSFFPSIRASQFTGCIEDGPTKIRVSNIFVDDTSSDDTNSLNGSFPSATSYIPCASVGLFGEKLDAVKFYVKWLAEFKKSQHSPALFCQNLIKFAQSFADSSEFSMLLYPTETDENAMMEYDAAIDDDGLEESIQKLNGMKLADKFIASNGVKEINGNRAFSFP